MCSLISLTTSSIFNVRHSNHPSQDDWNVFITLILIYEFVFNWNWNEVFQKFYDERKL